MGIKDKVVSWYIRTILLPKREIIDKPGFICEKIGEGGIYLREFAFPNFIGIGLENGIADQKILYNMGKNFGWNYASTSEVTTIDKASEKDFMENAHLMVKYMEAISFAKKMNEKIDYKKRIFRLEMEDSLIYSHNGKGYIFERGGIAGIWAYVTQDKTVESVIISKSKKKCLVIAAPYETLVKMKYKPIKCTQLETFELDSEYGKYNKMRRAKWSSHSLRNLIDSGFFKYKHGHVTYGSERFFLCEASFMYILEKELKKVNQGLGILWDVSFGFGKKLAKIAGKQDPCKFISDFLPALGFGDILAVSKEGKYEVSVNYFPWLKWHDDIDFTMFRGLLSGIISGMEKKEIELKNIEKDLSAGYLSFTISA